MQKVTQAHRMKKRNALQNVLFKVESEEQYRRVYSLFIL